MKKIFCLIGLTLFICQASRAQFKEYRPESSNSSDYLYEEPAYNYNYIVLSAGIDNYVGLAGIGIELPVSEWIRLKGGLGLGLWGFKFSGGLKYQANENWGFGIGYSHCPGVTNVDYSYQDGSTTREFNMDFLKCGSVNLSANRDFYLSKNIIFYLETGIAFATGGEKPYRINDGTILTDEEELTFQIMRPGGITLAGGFKIGF